MCLFSLLNMTKADLKNCHSWLCLQEAQQSPVQEGRCWGQSVPTGQLCSWCMWWPTFLFPGSHHASYALCCAGTSKLPPLPRTLSSLWMSVAAWRAWGWPLPSTPSSPFWILWEKMTLSTSLQYVCLHSSAELCPWCLTLSSFLSANHSDLPSAVPVWDGEFTQITLGKVSRVAARSSHLSSTEDLGCIFLLS